MKGSIFTCLQEMVEEHHGIRAWNTLLQIASPPNGGAWVSCESYPDEQLYALVDAMASMLNVDNASLLRAFGQYLFPRLHGGMPVVLPAGTSLFDFLELLDNLIHFETRKIDPFARPPRITMVSREQDEMILRYESERSLAELACGLIEGAGNLFAEPVSAFYELAIDDESPWVKLIVTRNR